MSTLNRVIIVARSYAQTMQFNEQTVNAGNKWIRENFEFLKNDSIEEILDFVRRAFQKKYFIASFTSTTPVLVEADSYEHASARVSNMYNIKGNIKLTQLRQDENFHGIYAPNLKLYPSDI